MSEMEKALRTIIPHMYGEHNDCGDWCRYDKDENYKHTGLPRGNDLKYLSLRSSLEDIIETYVRNSNKLLTTGDSQANESLNAVAWSKAPKTRNYTGSESFSYRMASAVCQFNEGKQYVSKVIENANMSPQKITEEHNSKEDRVRQYLKSYKGNRSTKRRRIELKKDRLSKQTSLELREGTTYKTNCASVSEETIDNEYIHESVENLHDTKIAILQIQLKFSSRPVLAC